MSQVSTDGSTPGRRKRPRVIAPPQHLESRVQLTGSYAPVPQVDSVVHALAESAVDPVAQRAARPRQAGDSLAEFRGKDEDPRLWGDASEDLAELMKREKPPHWG